MKTLYLKDDEKSIATAAEILKGGGLVAIPTETVYGLAANALDGEAVKRIFEAKGRPQDNPLIVHVSCAQEIPPLVAETDERLYALAEKFWPGPLTVVMKKSALIPDEVSAGLDTVAIRMPSHPAARAVIKASGLPLAAPSANLSGRPSPTKARHVMDDLEGKIDAVIDGGPCSVGVESTVITLETEPPMLLRPGGITPEQLEEVLGKITVNHAVYEKLNENEEARSPGMKYKHYAPKAEVTLIKGGFEVYEKYLKACCGDICAVCYEGEGKNFDISIEFGKKDDYASQARGIFEALRQVDEKSCKKAFVRCPEPRGIGLAVYNRLLRSAAFRVLDLDFGIAVYGITGQTGSGKSTLCKKAEDMGIAVIYTDKLARTALESKAVQKALAGAFGGDIIENGAVNRALLAKKAFSSPGGTELLNACTHPEIIRLTVDEIHRAQKAGAKAALIDAPVLFATPLPAVCRKVICVTAPANLRKERIKERDGLTDEQADMRINAQQGEEDYKSKSDFIIENISLEEAENKLIEFFGKEGYYA
ncbi:MAG: threonylcarbamoyl-AMP synthase [Clostridia bacterium]|nr:threonylcarbamoyl-AMP synthase [Clostridia bacterium]